MEKPAISKFLKLSPNEIENAVREAKEKWKKFRLLQVRAQAKEEAFKIRELGKAEEDIRKSILKESLKVKWEKEQKEQLKNLNLQYKSNLQEIGEAHKNAEKERIIFKANEEKKIQSVKLAHKRGIQAIHHLGTTKTSQHEKENSVKTRRQNLREIERSRSKKISRLPTPEKFKPKKKVTFTAPKKVEVHKAGTFTTSHYIPPSSIVQKEIAEEITAHEAAARQSKEEAEILKKQMQKEKEQQEKIAERGRLAWEKKKLRDLQTHLLEELEKADQEHQLSDYLKGNSSDEEIAFADELAEYHRKKDEKEHAECHRRIAEEEHAEYHRMEAEELAEYHRIKAEEMVKELLLKERQQMELINAAKKPTFPERSLDSDTAKSVRIFQREDKEANCRLQRETDSSHSGCSDHQDIHLKETVPVDQLPFLNEKFKPSRPCPHRTSDKTREWLENISTSSSDTPASSISVHESTDPRRENFFTSYDTEYLELPKSLEEKLKIIEKPESRKLIDDSFEKILDNISSSTSTEYLPVPDSLPRVYDDSNDKLWENLKQLQKNSEKIRSLCTNSKLGTSDDQKDKRTEFENLPSRKTGFKSTGLDKKKFQTFKTPPRLYSEEIKSEGSGERPLTRREKFERCKKKVIEHYMKRLIQMKPDELNHLSVSSVEGSGFTMSSDTNLCDLLDQPSPLDKIINTSISSSSQITTIPSSSYETSTMAAYNGASDIDDVDKIPVKLSSSSEICYSSKLSKIDELSLTESEINSSAEIPSKSSSIDMSLEQEVINKVHARLWELERMKLKILSMKQPVNCWEQKPGMEIDQNASRSSIQSCPEYVYSNQFSRRVESTFESSIPSSYKTPTREIEDSNSSFAFSRSSALTESSLPHSPHRDVQQAELDKQNFLQTNGTTKEYTQYLIEKHLNSLRAAMQNSSINLIRNNELQSSSCSGRSEAHIYQASTLEDINSKDEEKQPTQESSSSSNSMPDMNPILERFGLSWAQSMIRKMDKADEKASSDS